MDTARQRTGQGVRKRWPKRWVVYGAVIGVLLVVIIALTLVLMGRGQQPSRVKDAYDRAASAHNAGRYQQELEELRRVANDVTGDDKVKLYSDLAAAASSAGEVSEAIAYYQTKHTLDPASKAADGYLLGTLYERNQEIDKALEQYQLFLTYLEAQPADEYREAQITSLKSSLSQLKEAQ